jgi:hypothetical protein
MDGEIFLIGPQARAMPPSSERLKAPGSSSANEQELWRQFVKELNSQAQ